MSQSQESGPLATFGPNEWLVDEMYQRYLQDPESVDRAWWDFFTDYVPAGDMPNGTTAASTTSAAPVTSAAPTAPAPERDVTVARATLRRHAPAPAPADGSGADLSAGAGPGEGCPADRRRPATCAPQAASRVRACRAAVVDRRRRGADQGQLGARVVTNMDASLSRADRDQRARGPGQAAGRQPHRDQQPPRPRPRRQGVVHPPDRLRAGPGARRHPGDEQRLRRGRRQAGGARRPSTSTSASRSTCPSRTAPARWWCPTSRAPRRWTSRQFWPAYEDVVRRARRSKLTDGGLRRHHDHADQPRPHRHRPLGAAADARPGRDHRRRRDGVPGRVPGHVRRDAGPSWPSARSSR